MCLRMNRLKETCSFDLNKVMGDKNGVPSEGVTFSRKWRLMDLLRHSQTFLVITFKRKNTTKLGSSIWDQINNVLNSETLTHIQLYMKEMFGKGKKDLVFHSIITSNELQIVHRSVVAVPDSFPDSRGQSVSVRVLELFLPFSHERPLFYR